MVVMTASHRRNIYFPGIGVMDWKSQSEETVELKKTPSSNIMEFVGYFTRLRRKSSHPVEPSPSRPGRLLRKHRESANFFFGKTAVGPK